MKLSDRKDRTVYTLIVLLLALLCAQLVGELRGFFLDIWALVWSMLGPFVFALIATYVLRPVVDALEARRVPRTLCIILVYALLLAIVIILLQHIIPVLGQQAAAFARHLPGYIHAFDRVLDHLSFASRVLPNGVRIGLERAASKAETAVISWLSGAVLGLRDVIGGALSAVLVPFVLFYLLKDYSLFTRLVVRLFPVRSRSTVQRILTGIDHSLGRYVRGQLLVMALVGAATFVGLAIIGMPYALLLSLIVALTNIIPYVGPFIGAAPALFMALGVSTAMLVKVLVVNLIVQQLEGNVFSPWIMGRTMKLHPLLILLAVMVAGEVAGVTGLIFAVPILAVTKVIVEQVRAARPS
jgi:predicted PurR-regulated permease PerM